MITVQFTRAETIGGVSYDAGQLAAFEQDVARALLISQAAVWPERQPIHYPSPSSGDRFPQYVLDTELEDALGVERVNQSATYVAGHKVSTDGSHGLPAPTGSGLEFVFTAGGLDDIRYDGVSQ